MEARPSAFAPSGATIEAAKGDFPEQTSAMRDSLDSLKQSAGELSESPMAEDIAPVATDVAAMVTAVENFARTASPSAVDAAMALVHLRFAERGRRARACSPPCCSQPRSR